MGFFDIYKGVKKQTEEGFWDFNKDIYDEYAKRFGSRGELSKEDSELVKKLLAMPDIRPYDEEGTLEAWLLRISLWGKIMITQTNKTEGWKKRSINKDQFLDYVSNEIDIEAYGPWKIDVLAVNKIKFYRDYWGIDGKTIVEDMTVEIDLRPDLKARLRQPLKKNSFWGKLGFFK